MNISHGTETRNRWWRYWRKAEEQKKRKGDQHGGRTRVKFHWYAKQVERSCECCVVMQNERKEGGRESWVECRDRYLQSFACAFHHKFTGHVIVGQNRISWIFFHAKDYYGSGHFRITPFQDLEKAIDAFQRTYHFTSGVFVLTGSSPTHFGRLPIPTHQPALPIIWWLPTREVVAWLCSG